MKLLQRFRHPSLFILLLAICVLSLSIALCGSPSQPSDQQADQIEALHIAGLQGDRSQIPTMLQVLKTPSNRFSVLTSLHAVGQLGIIEALPAVENLQQNQDAEIAEFAKVAKARILAENDVASLVNPQAKATQKTRSFYENLQINPPQINEAVSNYAAAQIQAGGNIKTLPLEIFAMRELADMVYRGTYSDYASLPGVISVNFALDYPSALKMRLAPLSHGDRINTMIQDLAHKKNLSTNDDYEIQLLSNEGVAASGAIVAVLQDLDAHREKISADQNLVTYTGISALVRVLCAVGDPSQAPLMDDLRLHPKGTPALCNETDCYYIKKALKRPRVYGF